MAIHQDIGIGHRCERCGKITFGRKRKYCSRGCQNNRAIRPVERACEQCGKKFAARPDKKCCSKVCKNLFRARCERRFACVCAFCNTPFVGKKNQLVCSPACKPPAAMAKCVQCGIEFRRYAKGRGSKTRLCSRQCRDEFGLRHKAESQAELIRAMVFCGLIRKALDWRKHLNRLRLCDLCGIEFEVRSSGFNKHCSEACRKSHARQEHRKHKRIREARKKNAICEPYIDNDIFVRDKWKCWLCDRKVSQMEKVPHNEAATIDHVIPLAAGGADAPWNVHCAHFLCNVTKNDSVLTLF